MPPDIPANFSRLERFGIRVLTRASDTWPPPSDPIDFLSAAEQKALRRIAVRAVLAAAAAGALSAAASSLAVHYGPAESDTLRHWAVVGAVSLVATGFEFAFLYWDGLRAVRAMAKAAGLRVTSGSELDSTVAVALARAALELPSPPHNWLGVDPHRDVPKLVLVLSSLLYKGKVALTNFLVKAAARRLLGPLATRTLLLGLAVPVTAAWNAIVAHQVLWQARIRVMGPSAAVDIAHWISAATGGQLGPLALRAIGSVIVANREAHPNVLILARTLVGENGGTPNLDLGHRKEFLALLGTAPEAEVRQALRAAVAGAILDGRITRREWRWLDQVFQAAGRKLPSAAIRQLRRSFVTGRGVQSLLLGDEL